MRTVSANAFRHGNKQSAVPPKPGPDTKNEAAHAALRKIAAVKAQKAAPWSRCHVDHPNDPYKRTHNMAQRSARRGSHALPAAQTLSKRLARAHAELPTQTHTHLACSAGETRRVGRRCVRAVEGVLACASGVGMGLESVWVGAGRAYPK